LKALVTGAGGQLAAELRIRSPAGWTLEAFSKLDLDIRDAAAVEGAVAGTRPDLVFNAAAYTAVDRAETETEVAWAVNRDGAANLARAAAAVGAQMVHLSTDFVFDGRASRAYRPDDTPGPLGVYGASKLAGEIAVRAAAPGALVVRTAWVYSPHGANFLKTMLRLMRERGEVRVVADQIGAPTSAATLADALWDLALAGASGIHHYTDAGVATWYDFAQAIGEEAHGLGLLAQAPSVQPIGTRDYPTPARRPAFSVLDTTSAREILGRPSPHWRVALRETLARMVSSP
jgi:dTDP-4-dehydrorhamnose reductase